MCNIIAIKKRGGQGRGIADEKWGFKKQNKTCLVNRQIFFVEKEQFCEIIISFSLGRFVCCRAVCGDKSREISPLQNNAQ